MSSLPPLPPGYKIEEKPDPWTILQAEGFVATNGFRTDEDVKDIRRQGYTPAAKGAHNRGDGVDLTHPKLSPKQQAKRLRELAREYGWKDAVVLNEGHHRHFAIPGWGAAPGTPGTPNSGLPPMPEGFKLEKRGSLTGGNFMPTGQAVDGDTIRTTGGNARLRGVDAFELRQEGRSPTNAPIPLGVNARDFLSSQIGPQTPIKPTGGQTYGRPIVDLGGNAENALLRGGHALAMPEYLKGDPRFSQFMEAERLARLNRLGAHGNTYQTPDSFRAGNPDPWEKPEAAAPGERGQAVFWDEPTPFMGLRSEIEQAYVAMLSDPKNKEADILAFAESNGFTVRPEDVRTFLRQRDEEKRQVGTEVEYLAPPRPVTDLGHGAPGAFGRGFADPFNFVDEVGGAAHAVGLPALNGERENIWNSDRRFGDIWWNNIDQNRAILAHDDMAHPVARFGGQIASAVALPYGAGFRTPMQIAKLGAIEGTLAGAGAGEGGVLDRAPNALLGTALGASGGYVLGQAINTLSPHAARALQQFRSRFRRDPATPQEAEAVNEMAQQIAGEAAPIVNEGMPNVGPTPAARNQPSGGVTSSAAMRAEDEAAELVGPIAPLERERDYLDLPPLPRGYMLEEPFGAARRMDQRLSPEEMARLADDVDPRSVLPRPGNQVESLEEAMQANPGSLRELEAPDEMGELAVRKIPSRKDFFKHTRVRGPLDLTQRLRTMGGIKDEGGELTHLGITNEPRRMAFGSNEHFLGRLVDNENGMPLDEATMRLWEEGYLPEFKERPTPHELLDRLKLEAMGQRTFHPDDLEEVSRFESAQADRYRIEEAANEGSPLAEQVGETITLDDLEANMPPAEAYEDMPRLTGKVGNINLDRLEKPQDVAQLIRQVQSRVGGFSAASRGRVTNEETRRLATEIGVRPEDLLKRRQGQALNAEQLYATRVLVQKSREVVAGLAKKAVGGTDEDVALFRNAWLRHVALEEQVTGATSEAGRSLQQFKMLARAGDARGQAVRAYLKGAGGRETIEDAAQAIVDLMEDPAKASHFMREAVKPRWRDKINELWINSLLSGPKTHVVNFVGNAMTTLMSLPEQALTAGIGKVLRSKDRAFVGEVGARVVGMADSAVDALRAARRGFLTGEPADAVTKVEAANYHAIPGKLGQVIRTPTRALTAADEFWKTINSSAEMRALAYRKAAREGGTPAEIHDRYKAILRAPTEEMMKQAQSAARYYTFQKELGPGGKYLQGIANEVSGVKIILPFVRTPINLLKFAGERSIFGVAMPSVRQALRQGGRARDEALARITLGSGLSTAAVMATLDGRITGGGPTDPRERSALLQSGWQPYSMRSGDEWVSFQRFDPFSLLIGAAADFAEIGGFAAPKERDEFALNLAMAIAKNITSKTWLSGLSDFFDALSDPERFGKSWAKRMAGSAAVPSIGNQTAQALDPHMRDAQTILEAIKARVPVLSESVPVRRDVWGEPIERGDSLGPDIASPIYSKKMSGDPVRREIARLRVPLSMPQRFLRVDGQRVDLTREQYDELVQLSGRSAKSYLNEQIGSPEWQAMSDHERVEFVKEVMSDFRSTGRDVLLQRYPELKPETNEMPPLPPGFAPAR